MMLLGSHFRISQTEVSISVFIQINPTLTTFSRKKPGRCFGCHITENYSQTRKVQRQKQVASMSMKREVKLTKKRDVRGDMIELYQIMKGIEDEKGK